MTSEGFVPHWAVHVDALAAALQQAPRAVAYWHLPKTGGTSTTKILSAAPGWRTVRLIRSYGDPGLCYCGVSDCAAHKAQLSTLDALRSPSESPLFLKFHHERYAAVRWLLNKIARDGGSVELVATIRPVRQRLVSMFTDYWTQVFTADRHFSGEIDLTPHDMNVVTNYLKDAAHYRNGRTIDGEAWFRAFAMHGPGVPFLLSDVFDESVDMLAEALESRALHFVSTSQLDDFLFELTGQQALERSRVSVPLASSLAEAIERAACVLDEIVEREAPYDRLLAAHLADPSFDP